MAIATIRPGHLRIHRQTPASLQFQLGTQANTITSEHVGTCEGQTPSAEATEHGVPCSECPSSYVGQTGRQFGTRMKEHKGAVRRQDENSLLALHCLTSGHAFDWDRATVVGNGTSKYKREFVEAWNTTSTCVNQCRKTVFTITVLPPPEDEP